MSFFTRTLGRLRKEDHGFSLMETVVALGVLFVALLALARTAAVGFTDIALSRQRTQANQIANKVLEQVRGLSYERVGEGLDTDDLAGDPNVIITCPDGAYYRACPGTDPEAEKIVHSAGPSADPPLVPHRTPFGEADGYTTDYTASVYVTHAKAVPQTGAYRVTVEVTWAPPARPGVSSSVTTQSLLYTPEGTTDATTGGGTAPFFYGTGSIGRAPVTITPNAGVTGGTGVTGLPSWDSISQDLYGLDASVQEQQLARAESKTVMTGARKVVSGVETASGGDAAEAVADNDPATTTGPSSAPPSLMQSAVSAEISGGGNALRVEAASGGGVIPCPSTQPGIKWMTGFEHGRATSLMQNLEDGFIDTAAASAGSNLTMDTAVARNSVRSLKIEANAGQAYAYAVTGRSGSYVVHFAIRFASLPTASVDRLINIEGRWLTGTPQAFIGYRASTNKFATYLENGNVYTTAVDGGTALTAGQWYTIDMRFDTTTATHRLDWSIDGAPQTQVTQTGTGGANGTDFFALGTYGDNGTFTANYDDVLVSLTGSDYPLPDGTVKVLMPNGMGTSNAGTAIVDGDGTAIDANTWTRLDEIPAAYSFYDDVVQITASTSSYVEVTLQDTTDTCIRAVHGFMYSLGDGGNKTNNGQYHIMDGTTDRTIWNANLGPNLAASATLIGMGAMVTPATSPWTPSAVNGLRARFGYSNDVTPDAYWATVGVQYLAVAAGEAPEGTAGTETGSTASTTAASVSTPCGNPTQLDGRACSYAREDYSITGPPHLSARLDLTGSGAGKAKIYKFQPTTQAGSTSYVWGRRTAGSGGAGTVQETVVRYPGTHEFGALPSAQGSGPAGWLGYWVKYDAGSAANSVSAEAGIGSAAPTITSAGTVSYWNGSGYSTMTPPTDGSAPVIPAASLSHTSGSLRVDICPAPDSCSLAVSPSSISQLPAGASGTATRTEARATLGSPIAGSFTYKVTNTTSGAVIAYVTVAVDLGALSATARYAP